VNPVIGLGEAQRLSRQAYLASTNTETPQNTARIDRKTVKVPICRSYVRAILSGVTARKSDNIDRKHKYRPRYRPRNNVLICRSFVS
jgi:hypothetical protein